MHADSQAGRSRGGRLDIGTSSVRASAIAGAALLALAAIVFGSHVAHGGLFRDDWHFWLLYTTAKPGLGGAIDAFHWTWFRPLQMLWWPGVEAVLGPHAAAQIVFTLLLAVLASTFLFHLLTMMRVGRQSAMTAAALVLLFPASDAIRLWSAANVASAGLALYMLGAIVTLEALSRGGRGALGFHLLGLLLYLASLALYEVAAPAIAASVLLYRFRTTWRRAAVRWIVDLAAIVPFIVLVTSHSSSLYPRSKLSMVPAYAKTFVNEALTVLSKAIEPFGHPPHLTGLIVLACVGTLTGLAALAAPGRCERSELGRWALLAIAGLVVIAGGYGPYLFSDLFEPLGEGLNNRVNALPSIGYALVVCALLELLVADVFVLARRPPGLKPALIGLAAAAVAAGYIVSVRADIHEWDQAAGLQRQTLAAVVDALNGSHGQHRAPDTPGKEQIYVFDQFAFTAPGVPVFNISDDLYAALRARLGNFGPSAYPALPGALFYCEKGDVWMDTKNVALDDYYGDIDVTNYPHILFVDVRRHHFAQISTPRGCDAALSKFLPGPLLN